jgi:hypothetical protein
MHQRSVFNRLEGKIRFKLPRKIKMAMSEIEGSKMHLEMKATVRVAAVPQIKVGRKVLMKSKSSAPRVMMIPMAVQILETTKDPRMELNPAISQ